MRKLFSCLLLTVAGIMACPAITVEITPGELSQAIDDPTITELVLTGSMDARDFLFIAEHLNQLTSLDMSQVTIVPYSSNTPTFGTHVNYLGQEIPRTAFFGKPLQSVVLPNGIEGIGFAAFAGCDQLQSVVLPSSVTYLEDYAFAGSGLTSVDLPSTVVTMGKGVFSRCEALTSATINAREIGHFAFLGDIALAEVNIGSNVGYLNEGAFNGCTSLTTVNFDPKCSLARIGDEAFINSGLENINIKSLSLGTIGDWSFAQTRLTSIQLTDGMTHLGVGALAHNPYLTDVTLPDLGKGRPFDRGGNTNGAEPTAFITPRGAPAINLKMSRIGAYAFADDSLLNTGSMMRSGNGGIKVIEPYAFYNNSLEMDTMYLPATITFLGDSAMAGMTGMRVLKTNAQDVPELGIGVWAGVDQHSIPLITPSDEAKTWYQEADQWMDFFFAPDFLLGDVNMDGKVNIADVTSLIDYILSGNEVGVDTRAADVDQNGNIGIADVTALIDFILTKASSINPAVIHQELIEDFASTSDGLAIEPITLYPGETRTINVLLNNDEQEYSALQCQVVLPQGVELIAADGADRGQQHNYSMRKSDVADNVYSLMGVSQNGSKFDGHEGRIMRLTVAADDEFDASAAQVEITNIMLVTDENSILLAGNSMSKLNNNTAIEQIDASREVAHVTYINVAGQQSERAFDGMNIVVTTYTDGTTSTMKVVK